MADSTDSLESFPKYFRTITPSFRDEAAVQKKISLGYAETLHRSTQSAVAVSVNVKSSEDQH
ncbi:MAG: hypothetical protein WCF90_01740 [Methanomicrobiales archaeon]